MAARFHRWGRALGASLLAALAVVSTGAPTRAVPVATPARVVITQHNNVYLVDGAGGRRALTTRGTGLAGVSYPWYAWSPDGAYLLLLRDTFDPTNPSQPRSDLLLLDRQGTVLRTLAHPSIEADFPPTWASDGDQIAYVAPQATPAPTLTVDAVDLRGHTRALWRYTAQEGCGGATFDPAEQLQWQYIGYEGRAPALDWSIAGHRALYSATCAGGVNVTDTGTSATRRLVGLTDEVTANPAGATLIAGTAPSPRDVSSAVVLARLKPASNGPGGIVRTIGDAELPRWSRDGRTLYMVRRVPGVVHHLRDEFGNGLDFQTYVSAIWRADSDGSGLRQLLAENAYTFGPPRLSPDGHALYYTRIANDDDIWARRLAGNRTTSALLQRYRPALTVERLDLVTGRASTLVADAARPAVQP